MEHEKIYTLQMNGGKEKEPEKTPPPQQEPERRKDEPAHEPEPLTESPPAPIEPDEGWDRE